MEKMLEVLKETSEPVRQIQATVEHTQSTVEQTQIAVEATQVTVKDIYKSLEGLQFSRYLMTPISNWLFAGKERIEILSWLSQLSPAQHHDYNKSLRTPGTGGWLMNKESFREWKDLDASSLLWLHGIGKKTVPASRAPTLN